MQYYHNVQSTAKPPDKLQTPTMIDINFNLHQEEQKGFMPEDTSTYMMWVYDTYRFYDFTEYNEWQVNENRQLKGDLDETIAELSTVEAMMQDSTDEAIAELTMLIAGGINNV